MSVQISKWVATDGTEWTTKEAADKRDELDAIAKGFEARLGPRVESGRRALDIDKAAAVKLDVVALCHRLWPDEKIFQYPAAEIHPMSYAWRFLSEIGGPLNRVWWRFSCMDGEWEYEQPYYAINTGAYDKHFVERAAARG